MQDSDQIKIFGHEEGVCVIYFGAFLLQVRETSCSSIMQGHGYGFARFPIWEARVFVVSDLRNDQSLTDTMSFDEVVVNSSI